MSNDFHDRGTYVSRYSEHSSRLQNWIGAYGAGLASLLVYHFRTAVTDAQSPANSAQSVEVAAHIAAMHSQLTSAFESIAAALALQVTLLFINKWSQFHLAHTPEEDSDWSPRHYGANFLSEAFLIDNLLDLGSIILLGLATMQGLKALGLMT